MRLCFVSLLALAAMPVAHADNVETCDEQEPCVAWTMDKIDPTSCLLGGLCTVEVCMMVDSSLPSCNKTGTETFSHMCDQTETDGCPRWNDAIEPNLGDGTVPSMSGGNLTGSCTTDTGEDNSTQVSGKCQGFSYVKMCQEGVPGQTLYWILKDGAASANETLKEYTFNYATGCDADITCINNLEKCAGGTQQQEFERTWRFTIPDTTGPCAICGGPPPGGNGDPHCK
jgi:hypothetical protein